MLDHQLSHTDQNDTGRVFPLKKLYQATSMALLLACGGTMLAAAPAALADTTAQSATARKTFKIPAGTLAAVLQQYAAAAGISYHLKDSAAATQKSNGLFGDYTPEQGLLTLLADHGLTARTDGLGHYSIISEGSSKDAHELASVSVLAQRAKTGDQIALAGRVGMLGQQRFLDTPFSTVTYTKDFIVNRQAQEISAVVGNADASVYVPAKRGIYEGFMIRGFSSAAGDMTYNGLVGMGPNMRTSTEMADRVEILKGPSTLVNGMPPDGTVGGSINIVPKRAGNKALTELNANYESGGLAGIHLDVGRRFGEAQQFGVRLNVVHRDGDTPVDNQTAKKQLASLGLDWRSARARASLDLYQQDERIGGANFFGIFGIANGVTELPAPRKGDYALASKWGYGRNDTTAAVFRGSVDLSDTVTGHLAFGQTQGGYDALLTRNTLLNNAGDISVFAGRSQRVGTNKTFETGLSGELETGEVMHAWSLAVNHYETKRSFRDFWFPNYATTNINNLNFGNAPDLSKWGKQTQRLENKLDSVALVDTLSFGDIKWTIGARHQTVKSDNFNGEGVLTSAYKKSRLSPGTALLVKLNEQLSVYGNYVEGLSQGATAPETAKNAGEVLKPFQSKQYEAGLKLERGGLVHSVSVYQVSKPSAYVDNSSNIFGVFGEQRNRGMEWNIHGEIQPGLRIMAGAAYTEAKLTQAVNKAFEGKQATGVPKVSAKLTLEYDTAFLPGLSLNGNLNYAGKRYAIDDNRVALSPYTTLDLGARYRTKVAARDVILRATVQNVSNKAYWLGSWSGASGSGLSGGLGTPRTLQLSGTVSF